MKVMLLYIFGRHALADGCGTFIVPFDAFCFFTLFKQ
jgi:hypothetical protein